MSSNSSPQIAQYRVIVEKSHTALLSIPSNHSDSPQLHHVWLDDYIRALSRARSEIPAEEWPDFVTWCRAHPLSAVLREDPFLERAFDKPRGYPGDAVMLDMAYSLESGIPEPRRAALSPRGRALFHAYQSRDSCEAVRARKKFVAHALSSLRPNGRALAIACGHLREHEDVNRSDIEIHAFDQDHESIAHVAAWTRSRSGGPSVRTLAGKIADFVKGRLDLAGTFDLIYSTGLYDYLDDNVAAALTKASIEKLSPGGTLYAGNFSARIEMPFCDIHQDWRLVSRDSTAMKHIATAVASDDVSVDTAEDQWRAVVWLKVSKGARSVRPTAQSSATPDQ